jgi:hypothetical protein
VDDKLEQDITERLEAIGVRDLAQRLEWLQPYPVGFRILALVAIRKLAWSELHTRAKDLRHEAQHDLAAMKAQQREWRALWTDIQKVRHAAEGKWNRPDKHSEWAELHDQVVARIVQQGYPKAQAEAALEKLGKFSANDMLDVIEAPTLWFGRQIDVCAPQRLSGLAAADLADAVVEFNLTEAPHKPGTAVSHTAASHALDLLRDLYATLRAGDAARRKADEAEHTAADLMAPLLKAAAYYAMHRPANVDADEGRRELEIADAIRTVLFVRSAARLISWNAGWPEDSPELARWHAAAKSHPFDSAFSPPPVTAIGGLGAASDGKRVTVEGRAGTVAITHVAGKPISTMSLTDASGATVQVGLTHIKLDSGGLVAGTYARITGTYLRSREDFTGPVLIVERRNLMRDAKTSWFDWLAHELEAVITPIAHNLLATWSWALGPDGAGNPLQYETWSASVRPRAS